MSCYCRTADVNPITKTLYGLPYIITLSNVSPFNSPTPIPPPPPHHAAILTLPSNVKINFKLGSSVVEFGKHT